MNELDLRDIAIEKLEGIIEKTKADLEQIPDAIDNILEDEQFKCDHCEKWVQKLKIIKSTVSFAIQELNERTK